MLMKTLFRRRRSLLAGSALAALLTLGLVAVAPQFSSPASAQGSSRSCATPVTSAPAGPATVATASTSFGTVLVVGSGANADCSLYVLTSDRLRSLTLGLAPYACSDGPNVIGHPCDTVLWPALLTKGAPIAGPGVNPALLGTVTRTDVLSGHSVQQVTYAGLPLYRFFLDETPGQTDGANLFDPVTSPPAPGTWSNQAEGIPHRAGFTCGPRQSTAPRCWRHRWTMTFPSCPTAASPSTPRATTAPGPAREPAP